MIGWPRHELR